jgi:hypothetical protein
MTLITPNHPLLLNYKLLLDEDRFEEQYLYLFRIIIQRQGSVADANKRLEILLRKILVIVSLYSRMLDLI